MGYKPEFSPSILQFKTQVWLLSSLPAFGWGTKVYVQNQIEPSNGILHRFCLTGGSTLTSQDYNPSSVVYLSKLVRAIWRYLLYKFCALLCCSLSQYLLLSVVLVSNYWEVWIQFWSIFISQQTQTTAVEMKPGFEALKLGFKPWEKFWVANPKSVIFWFTL